MDVAVAEWIADLRCHLALSYEPSGDKMDPKSVVALLMDASSSLLYNKSILSNAVLLAEGQQSDASSVKVCKRVLLTCLAIRCCTGFEKDVIYTSDALPPLRSAFELCMKIELLFPKSYAELFENIKHTTLEKLLYLSLRHHGLDAAMDIFQQYRSKLQLRHQTSLGLIFNQNHQDLNLNYEEYFYKLLRHLHTLNLSLDKPFLFKLEQRLETKSDSILSADVPAAAAEELQKNISSAQSVVMSTHENFVQTDVDTASTQKQSVNLDCTNGRVNANANNKKSKEASSTSCKFHKRHISKVIVKKSIRNKWTKEEDVFVIKSVKQHGSKWAYISRMDQFSNCRSGTQIKDRWRQLVKQKTVVLDSSGSIIKVDPLYHDAI